MGLKKEHKALETQLKSRKPAKESPLEVAKPPTPPVEKPKPAAAATTAAAVTLEKRDAESQTDAVSFVMMGGTQPTLDHHDGIEIDQQTDTTQIQSTTNHPLFGSQKHKLQQQQVVQEQEQPPILNP